MKPITFALLLALLGTIVTAIYITRQEQIYCDYYACVPQALNGVTLSLSTRASDCLTIPSGLETDCQYSDGVEGSPGTRCIYDEDGVLVAENSTNIDNCPLPTCISSLTDCTTYVCPSELPAPPAWAEYGNYTLLYQDPGPVDNECNAGIPAIECEYQLDTLYAYCVYGVTDDQLGGQLLNGGAGCPPRASCQL